MAITVIIHLVSLSQKGTGYLFRKIDNLDWLYLRFCAKKEGFNDTVFGTVKPLVFLMLLFSEH